MSCSGLATHPSFVLRTLSSHESALTIVHWEVAFVRSPGMPTNTVLAHFQVLQQNTRSGLMFIEKRLLSGISYQSKKLKRSRTSPVSGEGKWIPPSRSACEVMSRHVESVCKCVGSQAQLSDTLEPTLKPTNQDSPRGRT